MSSIGYYYWRKHPVGARQQDQDQLVNHIRQVHGKSEGRYGSPRIADELREQGVKASRNRIARLMKKVGIRSIMYKKYRIQTTESNRDYPVAKNVLNREFTADNPGQKRVSDLTYIATGQSWLYLTVILDLANRKVVGWAMSDNMKALEMSITARRMALKNRPIANQLVFHSDQGIQYACTEFRDELKDLPVVQSMTGLPMQPQGELLGQCGCREFFQDPQVRDGQSYLFCYAGSGSVGYLRVYRGLVQPSTEAFSIELPHAQSTGILFLHFLNGRLKNLHYIVASPPASSFDKSSN